VLILQDLLVCRGARRILDVPALNIDPRRVTAILGHNGSGKSTLLRVIARQLAPERGRVLLDGKPLAGYAARELARRLAFLPQNPPVGHGLSVRELVALGRYPWRGLLGRDGGQDPAIVQDAMRATDVAHLADSDSDTLSGGERQRGWIAMLLAQAAPLLLLDEPTSALDLGHQHALMRLLTHLNRRHRRGVVAVLHDLNLAAGWADHIVAMREGRVAFEGSPADFLQPVRLAELYGVEFELLPRPDRLPLAVVKEPA